MLQHGININPGKTTLIQFTKKRGLLNIKRTRIEGTEIELKQEVKYEGVTLENYRYLTPLPLVVEGAV